MNLLLKRRGEISQIKMFNPKEVILHGTRDCKRQRYHTNFFPSLATYVIKTRYFGEINSEEKEKWIKKVRSKKMENRNHWNIIRHFLLIC